MKNFKTLLAAFVLLLTCSATQAGAVKVETWPLGDAGAGIESGIVRVVFTPTADFVAKEIAVILHETEASFGWNDGLAATMLNHYTVDGAPMIKHVAYDGNIVNWNTAEFKEGEKGKKVAVWLSVNVATDTYSLHVQKEGEATVTEVATDYKSRESTDGKGTNTATKANFCTLFFNDAAVGGVSNTASCVTVVEAATVVTTIEPYFIGSPVGIDQTEAASITVAPTVASSTITVSADDAISTVSVLTLSGQEVMTQANSNQIDVQSLEAGIYLVKVATISGETSITKVLKK